jgi:hypothetical protein
VSRRRRSRRRRSEASPGWPRGSPAKRVHANEAFASELAVGIRVADEVLVFEALSGLAATSAATGP